MATFGNCFTACLFVNNIVDVLDPVEETEFFEMLACHCYELHPGATLKRGDIMCTKNPGITYQHAFCYFDDTLVFQKHNLYELVPVLRAIAGYSAKQASSMWDHEDAVQVSKCVGGHSPIRAYRRKSCCAGFLKVLRDLFSI